MLLSTSVGHKPLNTSVAPKPHIAFVLVDDWGSADAGFRESELRPGVAPQLRTPTIDSLSTQGVQLSQYYVQHICSPTRTALLSGRYQIHTGLQDGIIQAWARVCLPPKFGTIGDAFSALGYATHAIGKWHSGIYRDSCLPWNRGFSTYYGFLTGSEHHYTKIQRIGRGDGSGNSSHPKKLYPDLRTHEGPVDSACIVPPFAPPPVPPTPCGLPSQPPCHYTTRDGYLPAGHDVQPAAQLTIAQAEAQCNAIATCEAITFEGTGCVDAPCKIYLKSVAGGASGGGGWRTLYKYPPPPSAQGNASCYSTHVFTERATALIGAHNASDASRPFFLYLALQDVHEPIEVPKAYEAPFAHSISDGTRRTYAGMVSVVDECIANVSAALKANADMWYNTILVLSNDNGGWVGYGGLNTPYRGHKTTLWEGGIRGLGLVVAPGRLGRARLGPSAATTAGGRVRFNGLFHVTDWLPTLVTAAGGSITGLDPGRFGKIDGVDQWAALTALSTPAVSTSGAASDRGRQLAAASAAAAAFPRKDILHNIEGVDGTGVAVLRVGRHKLLHRMQTARGFDGWCDVCNSTNGCWMPKGSGAGAEKGDRVVALGGQLCCFAAPPWAANHSKSCAPFGGAKPLPEDLIYDVEADPSEQDDLAPTSPQLLATLHARLRVYNESAVPCCICTGSQRTDEMDSPPRDGYWYSFLDQGPNPSSDCALQNEPVPPLQSSPSPPQASEFREYTSPNCTGKYTIGSIDVMDQCSTYHVPAPASIFVAQTNATTYESYHYPAATDCSGPRTAEGSFTVGVCSGDLGGYSQMRVWLANSTRYCTPGCECCPCSESHNNTHPGCKGTCPDCGSGVCECPANRP